jgi:hypothetical protein
MSISALSLPVRVYSLSNADAFDTTVTLSMLSIGK